MRRRKALSTFQKKNIVCAVGLRLATAVIKILPSPRMAPQRIEVESSMQAQLRIVGMEDGNVIHCTYRDEEALNTACLIISDAWPLYPPTEIVRPHAR